MCFFKYTIVIGLTCLFAVQANSLPKTKEKVETDVHPYTISNETTSEKNTIEKILEEIANASGREMNGEEDGHQRNKRAFGCEVASAYGSTTGTAFVDFTGSHGTSWPCGVDITRIKIWYGILIDAIQLRYRTYSGTTIDGRKRGGRGGRLTTITLQTGERITGVAGMKCVKRSGYYRGTFIRQLMFFSERRDGQKLVYGPYGYGTNRQMECLTFAVYGKITSIYGRVTGLRVGSETVAALGAIGFYYEDESRQNQATSDRAFK